MPPTTPGLAGSIQFVDIYHGDNVVDLQLARMFPLYGLYHKATQGVGPSAHDPLYAKRREAWMALPPITWHAPDGVTQVDIPPLWGAYDFNTGDPVKDQVANFLAIAAPDEHTSLCIDFEDNQHSQMTLSQLLEHLERVFDATGQYEKIYSGNRLKESIVHATDDQLRLLAQHDLWLCQYSRRAVLLNANGHAMPWVGWDQPYGTPHRLWAWQRDADGVGPDSHGVPGINPTGIDEDVFDGTPEQLMESWVKRAA